MRVSRITFGSLSQYSASKVSLIPTYRWTKSEAYAMDHPRTYQSYMFSVILLSTTRICYQVMGNAQIARCILEVDTEIIATGSMSSLQFLRELNRDLREVKFKLIFDIIGLPQATWNRRTRHLFQECGSRQSCNLSIYTSILKVKTFSFLYPSSESSKFSSIYSLNLQIMEHNDYLWFQNLIVTQPMSGESSACLFCVVLYF